MTETLYTTLSSSLVQSDHSDSAYDLETALVLRGDPKVTTSGQEVAIGSKGGARGATLLVRWVTIDVTECNDMY